MKTYREFSPTAHDARGLNLPDQQDWLVLPTARNRDSEPYQESNFAAALERCGGESDDCEVHRFGHWACGWFEIVLVRPGTPAHDVALAIERALENCPLLDEDDCSEREQVAADETWKHCYCASERVEYIRKHRSKFEFRSFADMLGCVRGNYFAGYASELLS